MKIYLVFNYKQAQNLSNNENFLYFIMGSVQYTTTTHVGGLEILKTIVIICCGHLPAL